MSLSTHVLDTARGRPAVGLEITLERQEAGGFVEVGRGLTDSDGRCRTLIAADGLHAGVWRISFATGAWYAARAERTFYPVAQITFEITAPEEHYHVPLLLSPYGISTYRGS